MLFQGGSNRAPPAAGAAARQRDAGQSLVEFALIAPLVLALLFGIVEFGRRFQSWLEITNAAAFGTRTGAVGASAADIEAATRGAATTVDPAGVTVITTNAGGPAGEAVVVRVEYVMPMLMPIFAVLVPGGAITVTARAT